MSNAEEYLKECGFKKDGTLEMNFIFYPAISCHTKSDGSFYFVLHFNPVAGSLRVKRAFTWKVDRKKLLEECLGQEIGRAFSITDSLLQRVQNSRSKSQKHWKKRNYPIAFSKKVVYNILKVDNKTNLGIGGVVSNSEAIPPRIQLCIDNMKILEYRAALNNSYEPFNLWLDEYKRYKTFMKKRKNPYVDVSGRFDENKAFEIFKDKVSVMKNKQNNISS